MAEQLASSGTHAWFTRALIRPITVTAGTGALTNTATLYIDGAATGGTNNYSLYVKGLARYDGNIQFPNIGNGLQIKEGTNARMGTATLSTGSVTINNTSITSNTRIFCMHQGTLVNSASLRVTARVNGTSFTVGSTSILDASTFAWLLIEAL